MSQINARIRQKRDTAANWTNNNPVLLNGELIVVETSTGAIRLKVGDGVKTFNQLPFLDEVIYNTVDSKIATDYLPLTGGVLSSRKPDSNYRIYLIPDTNSAATIIGKPSAANVNLGATAEGTQADEPVSLITLSDSTATNKIVLSVNTSGNASMTMSGVDSSSTTTGTMVVTGGVGVSGNIYAANVYGAVWNDFAEFREGPANIPGYVFSEVGDDTIELSRRRLQPGSMICSDTYGFAIGETDKAITPIAVAGRVLAYTMEDREEYRYHIGGFVGASENGRVTIMTPDEVMNYPESIIGTISAVPDYEEWGAEGHKVRVDGRVWIKVR